MGNGTPRTDYTSPDVYTAHASLARARGDKFAAQQLPPLVVEFDSSFDRFAANVAHAIRHYVIYRTDGGRFARGLVRDSHQLEEIHRGLRHDKTADGTRIRLAARLWRRQDVDPTRRWSMTLDIRLSASRVDEDEGEQIEVDVTASQKDAVHSVISNAIMISQTPPFTGDRGRRIRDMVKIADDAGYPANWNLWYYTRRAVYLYVRWDTKDPERVKMTQATNGAMPFDGDTGFPEHVPWRQYPIRDLVRKCNIGGAPDDCAPLIGRELVHVEDEILRTISEMAHEVQRTSMAAGQGGWQQLAHATSSNSSSTGALPDAFIKHVVGLMNDPHTFYSVYLKYSQYQGSIFNSY